jgi:hypothetical protein
MGLEVPLGTFGEFMGTLQRRHPTGGLSWRGGSADPREIFPSMYKRSLGDEKYIENISNEGVQPHKRSPRRTAWPGGDSCQGSPTASRRKTPGLDTSLSPRPFLRHMGNVQVCLGEASTPKTKTESAEVVVEVAVGSSFQLRRMRRNG